MQRYVGDLRSITQGRGVFSLDFSDYQQVPTHLADKIIAGAQESED
jgi:elongation factor G